MNYTEYKESAQRHLEICLLLKSQIGLSKNLQQTEHYLQELYYLVGYVYECSIKFVFYTHWYRQGLTKNKSAGFRTDLRKEDTEWIADYYRQTKNRNFEYKLHFPFISINEVKGNLNLQEQNIDVENIGVEWNETKNGLEYIISKFSTQSKIYEYLKSFNIDAISPNYIRNLVDNSITPIKALNWTVDERYISNIEIKEKDLVFEILNDAEVLFKDSKKFYHLQISKK